MDIVQKIKVAGLTGRGGANFPTWQKWQSVKDAATSQEGRQDCFVVCNAAEGEPDVVKDGYILEHNLDRVVDGISLAIKFLGAKKGVIFINHDYYKKIRSRFEKLPPKNRVKIEIFSKPEGAGYIGGEESCVLNLIEGRRAEPRLKPPFVSAKGLYNCPTLVNNVETFYNVSLVDKGEYKNKRFYTLAGDCLVSGVYELPDNSTIEQVLYETKNYPDFDFFVQVGGGASGEVLNHTQLGRPATGAASITIYDAKKYKPLDLVSRWLDFYVRESCGKCTPCREGVYRLREVLESREPDWLLFDALVNNLAASSFCGLGMAVPVPLKSYMQNVVNFK